MGRPLILSNGRMLVGLDERGLVHDFYFPYVGQDNLTTARSLSHKIGIWVDGTFSWVDETAWSVEYSVEDNALISNVFLLNNNLGIKLQLTDFVDSTLDAFIRTLKVTNLRQSKREIRVFFHQVFQISRGGRGDTAFFEPDPRYVFTYKGKIGLLSYCRTKNGEPFDQYAVGNYGVEGKEGTYKDAEDGELSGSNVEHGGVDSVMRVSLTLDSEQTDEVYYWTVAANSHDAQYLCQQAHEKLLSQGIEDRERATRSHWANWLQIAEPALAATDDAYKPFVKKSMMLIKAHIDIRGAVLASADSSIFNYGRDYYCYCWPRDASFALWPLIRLGYKTEAKQFFIFARDVISKQGCMLHKYLPDRSVGSTWHPRMHDGVKELAIQEDETAILIVMLNEYLKATDDVNFVASMYADLIKPAANFIANFVDEQTNLPHASYDIWEEKFLTTTYTSAVAENALYRAAEFAEMFNDDGSAGGWTMVADKIKASNELLYNPVLNHYRKGFVLQKDGSLKYDETLDVSSLYGVLMFSTAEGRKERLASTAATIELALTAPTNKGIARYYNDNYMRRDANSIGNPWFVCTLWMAQYYTHTGKPEKSRVILDWAISMALPSGVMSEQLDPNGTGQISVAPLVWSHAEFINTVLDLE